MQTLVTPALQARSNFIEGDIRNLANCKLAFQGVQHVLLQSALGSVLRSLADPLNINDVNIGGF